MNHNKIPVSFRLHVHIIELINELALVEDISKADLIEFLVLGEASKAGLLGECKKGYHFSCDKYKTRGDKNG
jgi:hypothetical protein